MSLQIAAFAAIAIPAERLEVIEFVGAAVTDRNDVVDFERFVSAVTDPAFVVVALKYPEAAAD